MSVTKQIIYIGLLFVGLMLLAAGIGALAAGEMVWGIVFLIGGIFIAGIDGSILYVLWKRNQMAANNPAPEDPESESPPSESPELEENKAE